VIAPADEWKPLVRCEDVTKNYDDGSSGVRALRGVNVDVRAGELTMLVGPSGCGKTTLLSVIAGILEPTSGRITVLDRDLSTLTSHQKTVFRGRNLGFVFQQYHLFPTLTAAENAAIPLSIAGVPRSEAVGRARRLLESIGLKGRTDAPPTQLSGGQQQRVAIARGLIHSPRILVCDEPTSALDHHTGEEIMTLLRQVAVQSDRAVIVVTHDSRMFDFADRIAYMDDGRVVEVQSRTATKGGARPSAIDAADSPDD